MKKENKRPLILVTNDDGIEAKGIRELSKLMEEFGQVVVVAPDGPRSGQSCAITAGEPLRLKLVEKRDGFTSYTTNGTPTDSVKLSMHEVFGSTRPDLIVSGINHGSNAGVSILYSGTMGAVLEGCVECIPSVGFSFCSHLPDTDFSTCRETVRSVTQNVLQHGLPQGVCLNVNIPNTEELKGSKICRQARGHWSDEYQKQTDPYGRVNYWLTGYFNNQEPNDPETDEWALANGYVSIVPCLCDMTDHSYIPELIKRFK